MIVWNEFRSTFFQWYSHVRFGGPGENAIRLGSNVWNVVWLIYVIFPRLISRSTGKMLANGLPEFSLETKAQN